MAAVRERAHYSHAGRRRANQDAALERTLPDGRELLAVADGMGGHRAGEIASARALEALSRRMETGAGLIEAVRAANADVHSDASRSAELQGMGTTLVALLHDSSGYEIANVGDSRAYRIDEAGIRQLTRDHSFTAEAMRAGTMSSQEAATSPWRNALTRALGTEAEVEIDLFGPFPAEPPHVVLLCSDGLYKAVPEALIREYVLATEDLDTAVHSLAALAFRNGSDDNITAAALELGSLPRRPATITLPVPINRQTSTAKQPPVRQRRPEPQPAPPPSPGNARRPTAYIQLALLLLLLAAVLGLLWTLLAE
ncbi:MAG TPA: protein phosphatase 2C domain-containing protein [Longimicrobiaceae bacterium]|nr:protein phosphatase 2C domain-containing protein [Longimicrobiaceae bacterium]